MKNVSIFPIMPKQVLAKIIICIVVIEDNIEKINTIINTWINLITDNIEYYFIIDKTINLMECIIPYIYVENLENNTHFNILKYFNDYDFILITYLDSFVNIKNLLKLLNNTDFNEPLYIGGHGDYRIVNNTKFWFHSYSPGIILTKPAADILSDDKLMDSYNSVCHVGLKNLSGVAIGYFCHLFNIKTIINNNFHYCNWKGSPCHNNNVKSQDIICCYSMNINDMQLYYKLINQHINFTGMNLIICPGGGYGNVLFQYFAGYSLSKKYNCNVYFQINYNYWRGDINKYKTLQHLNFVDLNYVKTDNFLEYNEKDFFYSDIELEKNNYKMFGYYQSYKYSEKYINQIKHEMFYNIATTYFKIEELYFKLKNDKPSCLIHVRRGDYLMYSNVHPTLKDNYYIKGIQAIPNCKYFIFSDDNNFVRNWPVLKGLDYEIVNLTDPEEILIFMTLCENFIIANSTLSLVGYLLRNIKDAKLVAPKTWFGEAGYKYKIEDIIPPNGILI